MNRVWSAGQRGMMVFPPVPLLGNCTELQFLTKLTITQCCVLVLPVTVSCHGNTAMQDKEEGI